MAIRVSGYERSVIWVLVLVVVMIAVAGGLVVSKFLLALLAIAVVLALMALFSGPGGAR